MKTRNKNITTLEEIRDQWIGANGSPERIDHERGYELFKIGVMICQARLDKGMSAEQLAQKCGVPKALVNKIEMEAENCKISDLRNVIENGLGGRFQFTIQYT